MRTSASLLNRCTSLALVLVGCLAGCGGSKGPPAGASLAEANGPIAFSYDSLDARPVSSAAFRGKVSVLAFVATGDLASQAQVDFLAAMAKNDGDRVNYALVALQDVTARELVEGYRDALEVTFPVALGDTATTAGGGPFGDVHSVPSVVVLDVEGRIAWRKTGLAKADEIREHMRGL